MLVLSRKKDEDVVIGHNIIVKIVDIRGDKVRLGIEAPKDIPVHRSEVAKAITKEMLANERSSVMRLSKSADKQADKPPE